MVDKIEEGTRRSHRQEIAVLGLSFKPNTDDMRDAPSLTICSGLAARGAVLRVWDPAAVEEAAGGWMALRTICFARDEYDAVTGADAWLSLRSGTSSGTLTWNGERLLRAPCSSTCEISTAAANSKRWGSHTLGWGSRAVHADAHQATSIRHATQE